ncbi:MULTISPECIES: GNAT family N-acetyltransferase [Bacillus cereus group]|uniref:Acetyltransferase (GNAT) family protein n=1 Tax=Bacillus paranthracis TaxID=2026186 RepID=A0A9X8SQI6_9BACI|nr:MULTISPECIES: GNAT family N-acetyltransferase [Bacillus cereus group]ONG81399.1 GNAT family N-acetyltransferase [Bacillus cereus]MDA1989497.1 GNAT family N-acetyltransferase [Bacillus cereus group sp. BcHK104]MDX6043519.1 GNAT family N-acetyltransferase [Bacillus paranthracis]SME52037.1 Acetyltransferase (GNAT) family protein [Bacillus paranthracis]GIX56421.1 N-acetyltransferase [Bacillus paranthracis]
MKNSIHYTSEHPTKFNELLALYESLGWNSLKLTVNELEQMCKQSWYAIYAFKEQQLIGMGRVISDGVITGVIYGVCVMPEYQYIGIGKDIVKRLIHHCEQNKVIPQLMCVGKLQSYYESIGLEAFSIGMTKHIMR